MYTYQQHGIQMQKQRFGLFTAVSADAVINWKVLYHRYSTFHPTLKAILKAKKIKSETNWCLSINIIKHILHLNAQKKTSLHKIISFSRKYLQLDFAPIYSNIWEARLTEFNYSCDITHPDFLYVCGHIFVWWQHSSKMTGAQVKAQFFLMENMAGVYNIHMYWWKLDLFSLPAFRIRKMILLQVTSICCHV